MRALQLKISGSYVATDKEIESYDGVVGLIPFLDEDKAAQMARKRYAVMWIQREMKKDGETQKYKRVQRIRECFIDDIVEVELEEEFSFVGKNILSLTFEELQDLGAAKDLIGIPLFKKGSLAHQRKVAYAEYAGRVLGVKEIDPRTKKEVFLRWSTDGFNPSKLPPIECDGETRRMSDEELPDDIEAGIDIEQLILNKQAKAAEVGSSRLDLEQLKKIADSKTPPIPYHKTITRDQLYSKIYGKGKAA